MTENYKKLFTYLSDLEVPDKLFDKVISRINWEKRVTTARKKIILYSSASIFSISALVGAFYYFRVEMASSGFINYFSLLYSDFDVVLSSWQNFSITLLEALPTTSLILMLISAAMLMYMVKNLLHYMKNMNQKVVLVKL